MSLRLLCEFAATDKNQTIDQYIKNNFANAKKTLRKESKTFLMTQSVDQTNLVALLHIGAHAYKSAISIEQTIAISIILGEMLSITHK